MAPTAPQDITLPNYLRDAISSQREEAMRSQAGTADLANGFPPSITLDLGSRSIMSLPEEFFEVVKNELERLALSHNQITSFPSTLASCYRLRYFNARHNNIREFPPALLLLSSLEVLDLSRNKLKALPNEISNMKSLKVLAVSRNKLEQLPVSLGQISSLNMLKFDGNELSFPPPEVCKLEESGPDTESESKRDVEITTQIKRYLRHIHAMGSVRTVPGEDSSDSNVETPRPAQRKLSDRIPTKPSLSKLENTNGASSISPKVSKPPPIPSRSHYRNVSKYGNGNRRPTIAPLNTGNDRNRSSSESIMFSAVRAKRMGLLGPKKPPEAESSDGVQPNGSDDVHGLVNNSVYATGPVNLTAKRSSERMSPADRMLKQSGHSPSKSPKYKHRLRNHPVETAKTVAYSLFQLQPYLGNVAQEPSDAHWKASSLKRALQTASSRVGELDRELTRSGSFSEDDGGEDRRFLVNAVKRACDTAITEFENLCNMLLHNIHHVVSRSDRRYLRTLLLLMYGSTMEIRNACGAAGANITRVAALPQTAKPGDNNLTPTQTRPQTSRRIRGATTGKYDGQSNSRHLRPSRVPSRVDAGSRSNITNIGIATPRSARSFTSATYSTPEPNRSASLRSDAIREERQFEKIVVKASVACNLATQIVPTCHYKFATCKNLAQSSMPPDSEVVKIWTNLCLQCDSLIEAAEALKTPLACIDLKDSAIRHQPEFWRLCTKFVAAWKNLVEDVRDIFQLRLVKEDIRQVLAPAAKAVKELAFVTANSKWRHLAKESAAAEMTAPVPPPVNVTLSNSILAAGITSPLPATPLSASLGPAVQATVPATPGQPPGGTVGILTGTGIAQRERLYSISSRR